MQALLLCLSLLILSAVLHKGYLHMFAELRITRGQHGAYVAARCWDLRQVYHETGRQTLQIVLKGLNSSHGDVLITKLTKYWFTFYSLHVCETTKGERKTKTDVDPCRIHLHQYLQFRLNVKISKMRFYISSRAIFKQLLSLKQRRGARTEAEVENA